MTNVIELAKQAGIHVPTVLNTVAADKDGLTRFATLVRNAALEEVEAKVIKNQILSVVAGQECLAILESLKEPTP